LGASRRQIWQILGAEYFLLGFLASLTGTGLAVVASWALATFVFKLSYAPTLLPLLIATASATTVTVLIGLLTSRGVSSQPPLEVLRAEVG
jgi:putative ABC transport system permease protein